MAANNLRKTDVLTISLPPELAKQVRHTAEAEHRTISELFRECYRVYRQSRLRATLDASHEAFRKWADESNLSEDEMKEEIELAIREAKAERRAERNQRPKVAK